MPGLGTAVTGEARGGGVGGQGQGGQRGRPRDDPVQDHRHPQRGGAEDEPGQGGVLEAAERRQDADGIGRFGWAVDPEGNRFELWEPAAE